MKMYSKKLPGVALATAFFLALSLIAPALAESKTVTSDGQHGACPRWFASVLGILRKRPPTPAVAEVTRNPLDAPPPLYLNPNELPKDADRLKGAFIAGDRRVIALTSAGENLVAHSILNDYIAPSAAFWREFGYQPMLTAGTFRHPKYAAELNHLIDLHNAKVSPRHRVAVKWYQSDGVVPHEEHARRWARAEVPFDGSHDPLVHGPAMMPAAADLVETSVHNTKVIVEMLDHPQMAKHPELRSRLFQRLSDSVETFGRIRPDEVTSTTFMLWQHFAFTPNEFDRFLRGNVTQLNLSDVAPLLRLARAKLKSFTREQSEDAVQVMKEKLEAK